MSTTTLPLSATAPSSSLARSLRIFVVEARYEFLRALRTRTYSLSVLGFPLMFYILFGLLMNRGEHIHGMAVARYLLGGYAVFGAVSAALFGVGVGLAAELNAGWLELKRASPMPPLAYLLAKCAMAMCFGLLIVCILTAVGMAFGSVTMEPLVFARMLGLTVVGTIPFASLALLLSLLVPANSAPGVTNLVNLPMSFLAGLWMPLEILPKPIQAIAPALPTYHLGQLMLTTLGFPARGTSIDHWVYLLCFTLVCLGAAGLVFRRIEGNS